MQTVHSMSRHHEQYKRQTVWHTAELRFLICEVKGGLDPNAPIRGSIFLFMLMLVTDMANQLPSPVLVADIASRSRQPFPFEIV